MLINRITATTVHIPYAAPIGPYVGRGGGGGTLGGTALVVRVETEDGLVGWGEGTGAFETDPQALLKGRLVGDIEGACAGLEAAGTRAASRCASTTWGCCSRQGAISAAM